MWKFDTVRLISVSCRFDRVKQISVKQVAECISINVDMIRKIQPLLKYLFLYYSWSQLTRMGYAYRYDFELRI